MIDFLVVGFGLSGLAVANHLENLGKKICVIDVDVNKASIVAAGLYNPVILKRFTMAWNAHEQLLYANEFYSKLERMLGCTLSNNLSIFRKFNDIEEQNKWFVKSASPILENYLDADLVSETIEAIEAPFGYGRVNNTGKLAVKKLIDTYSLVLKNNSIFLNENFDYAKIEFHSDYIQYNGLKSKNIIFCEGFKLKNNPFFNYLPVVGNKGCYLVVESPKLNLDVILKAHFFLVPLGNNTYKFGATYEHLFKGLDHNDRAKEHLIQELDKLIEVPYKIIDFQVGIRPTVIDRRPLVGRHPEIKNLFVFNGMGTRGILIAPTAAKQLTDFLLKDKSLPAEIDIKRFASLWKDRNVEKN